MRTRLCDTFGIEFPIFAFSHPINLVVNALGTPPRDVVDKVHVHGALVGICNFLDLHPAARAQEAGR